MGCTVGELWGGPGGRTLTAPHPPPRVPAFFLTCTHDRVHSRLPTRPARVQAWGCPEREGWVATSLWLAAPLLLAKARRQGGCNSDPATGSLCGVF